MEFRDATQIDVHLEAVSNVHRRRLLVTLLAEGRLRVPDRLASVAGTEADPETLRLELHHAHLPKLHAAGFVEWDAARETVRRGDRFDEIAPLLELLLDHAEELPNWR